MTINNIFFLIIFIFFKIYSTQEIITNSNTKYSDGFGSQFHEIISTIIYAELNNKKFVYTPFKEMDHNYKEDSDFISKKEWLTNFTGNFELTQHKFNKTNKRTEFFNENIEKCSKSESLKKIKKIFRANKNIKNYFSNKAAGESSETDQSNPAFAPSTCKTSTDRQGGVYPEHVEGAGYSPNTNPRDKARSVLATENKNFNIAIHVRRPNSHDTRTEGTDLPNKFYLNIINNLRNLYKAENLLFHIFSQGDIKNFKVFESKDTILHLDESIEDTFCSMVFADMLIVGPSSFSYVAGILSENLVYYIPFVLLNPLPHWKSVEKF